MPSSDGLMDRIRLRVFQALSQGSFLKVSNKRKDGTNYRDINCFRSLFFYWAMLITRQFHIWLSSFWQGNEILPIFSPQRTTRAHCCLTVDSVTLLSHEKRTGCDSKSRIFWLAGTPPVISFSLSKHYLAKTARPCCFVFSYIYIYICRRSPASSSSTVLDFSIWVLFTETLHFVDTALALASSPTPPAELDCVN